MTSLLADEDLSVRSNAARALGKLGTASEPAIPPLIKNLAHESYITRHEAAEALGDIGAHRETVIPPLINALEDENYIVGLYAAQSLVEFGPKAAAAVEPLLKKMQDTTENRYRAQIAQSLTLIAPDAPKVIEAVLVANQNEAVREHLEMLGAAALPMLRHGAAHEDPGIRRAARQVLMTIRQHTNPSDEAKKLLDELLSN